MSKSRLFFTSVCAVLGCAMLSSAVISAVQVIPSPKAKTCKVAVLDPKCDRLSGKLTTIDVLVKKGSVDGFYTVVTSQATYQDKAWKGVVNALAWKYGAEVLVYKDSVDEVRHELAKRMPKCTCFVVRPEEAGRDMVTHVHRVTRKLDSDPYTDTIWGILTGYTAADAGRIVAADKPLVITKGAGGTGIALDKFDEGIWYDEGKKNHGMQKTLDGTVKDIQTPDDTTQSIVDTINNFKPDYFQTSGHASERDWAPGYSYPNGRIICKDGVLMGMDLAGKTYPINSPNPKIYAPFGNCLIGHIPGKNCMALAWLGSGGAMQMMGYTVVTWYGYGGWGVGDYLFGVPGNFSFAESFYLNNQALVAQLNRRFPARAGIEFDGWDGPNEGMSGLAEKLGGGEVEKDEMGLQWDRDTVAFYGDPGWHASLKPRPAGWEQCFTFKGDVYTFELKANQDVTFNRPPAALFPFRLQLKRVLEGQDYQPVISDNFILLYGLTKAEKGKTYKVVFRAKPLMMGVRMYMEYPKPPALKLTPEVSQAIAKAGDNAAELRLALKNTPSKQRKAMMFLIANMPQSDLQTVSSEFLLNNVELAYKALVNIPWGKSIPEDVFLNYVLPYANVNERRDDWREDFYSSFLGTARKYKTPGEAAVALNEAVFKNVSVQYHATKRPKPDQSPYESIEAGYASCTGLSILLVDACRAVGIPTRVAGILQWSDTGGNHNWVEVWDNGKWHALGAAEPGPLDKTWFMDKAKNTDASAPEHRIYAVSFKKTGTPFPLVWDPSIKWVSATDVTESYTGRKIGP